MPSPLIRTSLELHPEMAQQVGLVIAEYAVLEHLMWSICALLSADPAASFRHFYKLRNLRSRCELVATAAKDKKLDAVLQRILKRLLRRFEAAADRRTEIAHCAYLADGATLVRLRIVRDEPTYEVITPAIFTRTFTQYYALGTDLITFSALVTGSIGNLHSVHQVTRAIPRAPQLQIGGPDIPRPPTKREADELTASLTRLGLTLAGADALMGGKSQAG